MWISFAVLPMDASCYSHVPHHLTYPRLSLLLATPHHNHTIAYSSPDCLNDLLLFIDHASLAMGIPGNVTSKDIYIDKKWCAQLFLPVLQQSGQIKKGRQIVQLLYPYPYVPPFYPLPSQQWGSLHSFFSLGVLVPPTTTSRIIEQTPTSQPHIQSPSFYGGR